MKKKIIAAAIVSALLIAVAAFLMLACMGNKADEDQTDAKAAEEQTEQTADAAEEADAAEDDYDIDYLVLVNKTHRLPADWEENLRLETVVNSVGDEVKVEKRAYEAYTRLRDALEEEGIHTEMDSAFRSVAEQQKIVDEFTEKYGRGYAEKYAAEPGTSEHHTGLAIDLYLIVDGKTVYENEDLVKYPEIWAKIHEKLPEYGFILRYPKGNNIGMPYEEWHIRYVGTDAAKEITERGITLEDYLQ